jgi:hypothetical protein
MRILREFPKVGVARFTEKTGDVIGAHMDFDLRKLPENMQQQLMVHGFHAKGGDKFSKNTSGTFTGAMALTQACYESLMEGDWNMKGAERSSDLLAALMEATGRTEDECRDKLSAMTKDQKKELSGHNQIKAIMARLAAERAEEKARKAAESAEDDVIDFDAI